MPELVLGPLLRYIDSSSATVWVETDAPCTVYVWAEGVDASSSKTFTVAGHHYAIVAVRGLTAGSAVPYSVELDDTMVWPPDGDEWPASTIRPYDPARPLRIMFGSCRAAAPMDDDEFGIDALHALAERMRATPTDQWPDLLLHVGDQVYADDNLSPRRVNTSRAGAAPKRGRDTRCRTSTSTRSCTGSPGHRVRSAGCSLRCRAR